MSSLAGLQDAAELLFLERAASAERHAGERILGDRDRKARLVPKDFVQALQERTAAGQDDALIADVGGQLRRRILEGDANALDDRAHGLRKRFGDLALVDRDLLG